MQDVKEDAKKKKKARATQFHQMWRCKSAKNKIE